MHRPTIVVGGGDNAFGAGNATGVLNVVAVIQLAVQRRDAAVSETFNSECLNLLAGAYLPVLFLPAAFAPPAA